MKNDVKQNYDQSNRDLEIDDKENNTEQEGYVDDTDFGPEVVKRNPNLVSTDLDDSSSDNDYDNDLDDDEDNE
jgi:hypothetical protein